LDTPRGIDPMFAARLPRKVPLSFGVGASHGPGRRRRLSARPHRGREGERVPVPQGGADEQGSTRVQGGWVRAGPAGPAGPGRSGRRGRSPFHAGGQQFAYHTRAPIGGGVVLRGAQLSPPRRHASAEETRRSAPGRRSPPGPPVRSANPASSAPTVLTPTNPPPGPPGWASASPTTTPSR